MSPGLRRGGKEAQIARRARHVVIDALGDRLADVARLERAQFPRALFDPVGELANDSRASIGAHAWPGAVIGSLARRNDRAIDVVGAGARDLREFALSRRLDVGEARGFGGIDIASGDEQSAFHR